MTGMSLFFQIMTYVGPLFILYVLYQKKYKTKLERNGLIIILILWVGSRLFL